MKEAAFKPWLPLLFFCAISLGGVLVHLRLWDRGMELEREDIYYSYFDSRQLAQGINPYARILAGDMRRNDKYATYFPLFYILAAGTQRAGLHDFPAWLFFWRIIFLACAVGIGYLVFAACAEQHRPWLGVFGAAFWFFNRWTLNVTLIAHLDYPALLLLLLSLYVLARRPGLACILFGLSLAIKQIAILALPLYLVWAWRRARQDRFQEMLKALALVAAVPLLVSLPFLVWNAEAFIKSLLFSATRLPSGHFTPPSLDALFGCLGLPARIPMGCLLALVYAVAFVEAVPPYAAVLLVMSVFFGFNSVLFNQYVVWLLPFVPLSVLETWSTRRPGDGGASKIVAS